MIGVFINGSLNTQYYKVWVKSKWRIPPPQHLGVVAIKKGAFGSSSTTIGQFLCFIYII